MSRITLAKTAGFCFGVNRAVNMVYQLLREGKRPVTLGPIIHNPQLVEELSARGVRILEAPEDARPGETVVLRSHGVEQAVTDLLEERGIPYADATCPFVAKLHRIVREQTAAGRTVVIAGDREHPEVIGIKGHSAPPGSVFVVADALELQNLTQILTEK